MNNANNIWKQRSSDYNGILQQSKWNEFLQIASVNTAD